MTIRLKGVHAAHDGTVDALAGVDLDVAPGSFLGILGPSGGGKSTLLRVIAGLHRPRLGRVEIDGEDVTEAAPERRRVGLVPQEGALFPHLTVAANVAYGIRGLPRRRALGDPRVAELLDLTRLAPLAARMPHELSGGQQQRVAVARALASEPRVMLLDEPFSALDAGLRSEVREDIATLLGGLGVTTILVTHDQGEALSLSDRIAILAHGRVLQEGTPEEVYREPVDAWTGRFLGAANILSGRADGTRAETALGPVSLRCPAHGPVDVLIRPEDLRITDPRGRPTAVVERSRWFGHDALVELMAAADGSSVVVRVPGSRVPAPGSRVRVEVVGDVAVVSG